MKHWPDTRRLPAGANAQYFAQQEHDMRRRPWLRFLVLPAVMLSAAAVFGFGQAAGLPPNEAGAKERLLSSPRHGEWAHVPAGGGDNVDAWLVYPCVRTRPPWSS